jgi:O-acetylhomoserine/O-acetylserine sulfhydrylase-like pyridoxal-dependent enzyme
MKSFNFDMESVTERAKQMALKYGIDSTVAAILIIEGFKMGMNVVQDITRHVDKYFVPLDKPVEDR